MTAFGLHGPSGAALYFTFVAGLVALVAGLVFAVRNRWISIAPLTHLLTQAPVVGSGLKILALSRLTWSLAMANESGLDANRAIELSVRTTQNTYYTMYLEQMKNTIMHGGEMHAAFAGTGVYPQDFLDALQTGEIAGRISESMQVVAKDYEGRAKNYVKTFAVVAGLGVLVLIGVIIISMIFNLFSQYLGLLQSAGSI